MSLKSRLALRFLLALGVLGALLFIPAGSLRFWQGWAYIAISFVPGLFAFTYFYKHDLQLIERRMQFKEKMREQKRIMTFVYIAWLVAFVLPGLDHRFGWSHSPLWITILSQAVVFGGFATTLWVAKVNLSRLSWKWRKRSSVKIAERTYEKRAQSLHCCREGGHSATPSFGQGPGFRSV